MKTGDYCTMNADAVSNYGEQWRGVRLCVTHWATAYMPAQEFYAKGQPQGFHPGYDSGAGRAALYDLARADNGESLPMSLYDWELRPA